MGERYEQFVFNSMKDSLYKKFEDSVNEKISKAKQNTLKRLKTVVDDCIHDCVENLVDNDEEKDFVIKGIEKKLDAILYNMKAMFLEEFINN